MPSSHPSLGFYVLFLSFKEAVLDFFSTRLALVQGTSTSSISQSMAHSPAVSLAYRSPARSSDRSLVEIDRLSLTTFLFSKRARGPSRGKTVRSAATHRRNGGQRRGASHAARPGLPRTARLAVGGPAGETTDFDADHKFSQLERMLLTAAVCTEMPAPPSSSALLLGGSAMGLGVQGGYRAVCGRSRKTQPHF